jgi:glycosyltransferase involved in cell wall biosynthesis
MKKHHPLHVVQIITKLEMGGAQKVCLTLKKGLDEHHHWASLISGTEGALRTTAKHMPHTILMKEFKREVSPLGFFNDLICFFKLIKILRSMKKQFPRLIVHTHSTKAGLMGRWAAFFAGVKKRIHTIHGYGFQAQQFFVVRFLIYTLELMTSLITTHYICVSTEDAKRGTKIFPKFSKKHTIIRAAVDWKQFYKPALAIRCPSSDLPFIFGSVGGLNKRKNHIHILKAFELVHTIHPHSRLELIGDGIMRTTYEQWIKDHNLSDCITLHGWQQEVASIMINWHAFLLTSLWEGMPCAIVEARLLKLPVLAYETNGIRDIIVPGHNGYIYQQSDWKELAKGMSTLIENPEILQRLQAFKENLSEFNDTVMINHHVDLYKSL